MDVLLVLAWDSLWVYLARGACRVDGWWSAAKGYVWECGPDSGTEPSAHCTVVRRLVSVLASFEVAAADEDCYASASADSGVVLSVAWVGPVL